MKLVSKSMVRRYLRMNAIQRGVLGRSKPWLAILGAGMVLRGVGKVTKSGDAPVLFSEDLSLGGTFEIVHVPPSPTRRQRRRAARAERRSRRVR